MSRFLLKSELETELPLAPDAPREKLEDPGGRYCVHLENAPFERGSGARRLLAFVICEADSLEAAHKVAREYLRECSETLTLLTSHRMRWRRDVCLWEWTSRAPNLNGRVYYSGEIPGMETKGHISSDVLESFSHLSWEQSPRAIKFARRWFSVGVAAATNVERFKWFWLTIEVLARHSEHLGPMRRSCDKCGKGVRCESCEVAAMREPSAAEVILAALNRHDHGLDDPKAFVRACIAFRNTITHGGSLADCEKRERAKLESVVDSAAYLARLLLLVEQMKASSAESVELDMLEPNTFLQYRATLIGVVAFKPPQDRELELSDIPGLSIEPVRRVHEPPVDPDSG